MPIFEKILSYVFDHCLSRNVMDVMVVVWS